MARSPSSRRDRSSQLPSKVCRTCGRSFAWRAKWQDDWDGVRYCSASCRSSRPGPMDRRLEDAILELARRRGRASSICPSEAARTVAPNGWRHLMERTRWAGRRLAADGHIEVLQRGRRVDAGTARGPIRYRIATPRV